MKRIILLATLPLLLMTPQALAKCPSAPKVYVRSAIYNGYSAQVTLSAEYGALAGVRGTKHTWKAEGPAFYTNYEYRQRFDSWEPNYKVGIRLWFAATVHYDRSGEKKCSYVVSGYTPPLKKR